MYIYIYIYTYIKTFQASTLKKILWREVARAMTICCWQKKLHLVLDRTTKTGLDFRLSTLLYNPKISVNLYSLYRDKKCRSYLVMYTRWSLVQRKLKVQTPQLMITSSKILRIYFFFLQEKSNYSRHSCVRLKIQKCVFIFMS